MPPDAWLPVPLRVRHVCVGDIFLSPKRTGQLWMVAGRVDLVDRPASAVTVVRSGVEHTAELDLDDTMQVLVPVTERDALRLTRDELGAALVERRTGT